MHTSLSVLLLLRQQCKHYSSTQMLHKIVVKLAKEANDNKDLRRRTERNLATLKAETITAAGKQMKGIQEEAARLEAAKEHCLGQLTEVRRHSCACGECVAHAIRAESFSFSNSD